MPYVDNEETQERWVSLRDTVAQMMEGGDTYRHYKGGTVRLIGPCLPETTLEPSVIYEHDGVIYCRDLASWDSPATVDGQPVQRFTKEVRPT